MNFFLLLPRPISYVYHTDAVVSRGCHQQFSHDTTRNDVNEGTHTSTTTATTTGLP
jgi:hypothetical protein